MAQSGAPELLVEHNPARRETVYTVRQWGCRIAWTTYDAGINAGVIQHRSDCPNVSPIGILLRRLQADRRTFRTLSWGRLYPDGARDTKLALRLAKAALLSPGWDKVAGRPRSGEVNRAVAKLAADQLIYPELRTLFRNAGLDLTLASVEKVLVSPAARLPFWDDLRAAGARATDRLPYDFQAWFSVRPR